MEKFSVKKPFTILVAVIVVLILGYVSLTRMTTELLPDLSLPYMMVVTPYSGASPEKVETQVSQVLERSLGTVSGVKNIYSVSSENFSIVQLEFEDGTDMDGALVKVSNALDEASYLLPDGSGTPSVLELSTDMMAFLYISASFEGKDQYELSDFVDETLIPYLERQEGVASVSASGLIERSVQVELNADKVTALNDKILAEADDAFSEALDTLYEARDDLLEGQQELEDSKKDLMEGQQELDDSRRDLIDGQLELIDSREEMRGSAQELDDARRELEDARDELEEQQELAYQSLAQFSQALDQLSFYQTQLLSQQSNQAALIATRGAVVDQLAAQGLSEQALRMAVAGGQATPEMEQTVKRLDAYDDQLIALEMEIAVSQATVSQFEEQLAEAGMTYADLEAAKMQTSAGFGSADAQLSIGEQQMESADEQIDSGWEALDKAQDQINDGWEALADAQEQLNDGWEALNDAAEQINSGWEDYQDAVDNYGKQRREALKKANANDLVDIHNLAALVYAQNFNMPAGYIDDSEDNSWLLKVGESFESVEELSGAVLCKLDDIGDVRLRDVADMTVIDNADDSYSRTDGGDAVILSVFKSSSVGTNAASRACGEAMEELQARYPGLKTVNLMDQGDYITIIVNSVLRSMALGAALAVLILALFLRDVKPTLVVAVSIPLSVLTALVCMYFADVDINMMSLSGLALGIGMLVDNSIVVMENIYRLRAGGLSPARAAVQGARQVSGAIIASTVTTVCVFFPLVYTTGTVRELMMPMSLGIIFCLMASLVIAKTVVPAACSTLLVRTKPRGHRLFAAVQRGYGRILGFCLRFKVFPLLIAVGMLVLTIWVVLRMGVVVIPEIAANQVSASLTMDEEELDRDASFALADRIMLEIADIEGVASVSAMSGGGTSLISSSLAESMDDYSNYTVLINLTDQEVPLAEVKRIIAEIEAIDGGEFCEINADSSTDAAALTETGLSVHIYGDEIDELLAISEDVMAMVEAVPGFRDISNGQEDGDRVARLVLDKDAAMRLGLTVAQIYNELAAKLEVSTVSTTVSIDGVDMDVVIKDEMKPLTRENLLDFTFDVTVTDDDGDQVTETHRLGEFAAVAEETGIVSIDRENQTRYITVTAAAKEGYNTTLLSRELKPRVDAYQPPSGYTVEMSGEFDAVMEMIRQMAQVIGLGLAFIYLVMVAQFQSLLSPFIIIFTVPLAFTGGMLGLLVAGEQLSIMGLMGLVILLGTVVNNGIVFVDYTNQLRRGGLERRQALIAAGQTRMRPILMTALTTILALGGLIFGTDMGSQMGRGMAIVVAGGLAYATLMTLFIVPVMYDILFKRPPLDIDTGDDLENEADDAGEYLRRMAEGR